jgi:hypothetical protein
MKILRALGLVLILSVYANAGLMDNGITTPPPAPATASSTTEPTVSGAADAQATESLTIETVEVALSGMQGILSVF